MAGNALSSHLALCWHSVMGRDTDVGALRISGEGGGRGQGVLYCHTGRGCVADSRLQLHGGQHPRRRDIEVNMVEQVFTRRLIMECHLRMVKSFGEDKGEK